MQFLRKPSLLPVVEHSHTVSSTHCVPQTSVRDVSFHSGLNYFSETWQAVFVREGKKVEGELSDCQRYGDLFAALGRDRYQVLEFSMKQELANSSDPIFLVSACM